MLAGCSEDEAGVLLLATVASGRPSGPFSSASGLSLSLFCLEGRAEPKPGWMGLIGLKLPSRTHQPKQIVQSEPLGPPTTKGNSRPLNLGPHPRLMRSTETEREREIQPAVLQPRTTPLGGSIIHGVWIHVVAPSQLILVVAKRS